MLAVLNPHQVHCGERLGDSASDTRTPLARKAEINCKMRDSIIHTSRGHSNSFAPSLAGNSPLFAMKFNFQKTSKLIRLASGRRWGIDQLPLGLLQYPLHA
jgi:hypothetical protein